MPPNKPVRVLFLCSEAEPFVKVGGLGDVGGSLPAALRGLKSKSHSTGQEITPAEFDVRLALPFHGQIRTGEYALQHLGSVAVPHTSGPISAEIYATSSQGVPVYLIGGDPIPPDAPVYSSDWGFDAHKYIFFSLAALELARKLDWQPQILHANDWHTAAAVYWLALNRQHDPFFSHTKSVLTVHNLPYMGAGASFPLASFYLPPAEHSGLPGWAVHMPLPLGLLTADQIVAVSPGYAEEILTPAFGAGLDVFLQSRRNALRGILNGLDVNRWNPETDGFLSSTYHAKALSNRRANKAALLNQIGFSTTTLTEKELRQPLVALIGRMDTQKGIDLALAGLDKLASTSALDWKAIILGSGQADLEAMARKLENKFPENIRAALRYDAPLSHLIYGGSDMLLIPSRYEPCGLVQMIAMRYGCVPIAHATGGLKDTIIPYGKNAESTGFLFTQATPDGVVEALRSAFEIYTKPTEWAGIQQRGMKIDFSWQRYAQEYADLYLSLIETSK